MRPQKVQDSEMLQGLMDVFRSKGYDGASLKELAEAAGLKKASLYHRFPGGKREMAAAVLTFVGERVEDDIFKILSDDGISPQMRLKTALDNIRSLYQDGEKICLFRALSMDTGLELFGPQIQSGLSQWLAAFTEIGLAFKKTEKESKQLALDTLIEIQGSLLVSKGMNSYDIFIKALKNIESRYR